MQQIIPIQFLRAFAAISVAIAHYQFDLGRLGLVDGLPKVKFGFAGVDVFFVVSGFVMVYASAPLFARAEASREFFLRRIIRIVPIYWLVTSVYLLLALAIPQERGYSFTLALASYFFIPMERLPDVVQPVVGQGWTLNYEMFFYALFAVAVAAPRRMAVAGICILLISIVLLGYWLAPIPQPLAFWSDEIILEFAFGTLIGLVYCEGIRLPKWAGWSLIALGCVLIYEPLLAHVSTLRSMVVGIPAACIVAGACLADFTPDKDRWRWLVLAGDASYALYLTHSFANRGVLKVATLFGFDLAGAGLLYMAAAIVGGLLLAVAIHLAFERPVGAALKHAFVRRQDARA
jgi:peptidoglycan/LPS O-acetylase OafA/YrhL